MMKNNQELHEDVDSMIKRYDTQTKMYIRDVAFFHTYFNAEKKNMPYVPYDLLANGTKPEKKDTTSGFFKNLIKKEIEYTVGRINGKYSSLSWRPIIYQYKSLSFEELVALYDLSDVGLITPLRDGMNLVAKEYIACQVENKGVLILSEMAGAAAELSEALIINPADDFETAYAIKTALELKQKEKDLAIAVMQKRISDYNVFVWAFDFFKQVFEIKEQQSQMNVRMVNREIADTIASSFSSANKKIFFLDYDGTLVPFTKDPATAKIEKKTLDLVSQITSVKNATVVIISGREKEFLEKQFHDVNVILVAEHGYFIKYPKKSWQTCHTPVLNWKESILPILNEYVSRCNGSFLEEKTGSIAWHYRNVESDFAQLRLHELRDDLAEIIRHKTDFEIIEGNKVLEIKSGRYDKGQAAKEILTKNNYDFIFAAGDDKTDEDLFKVLPEHSFSIKVGTSPSLAKYNVLNLNSLVKLLSGFCQGCK